MIFIVVLITFSSYQFLMYICLSHRSLFDDSQSIFPYLSPYFSFSPPFCVNWQQIQNFMSFNYLIFKEIDFFLLQFGGDLFTWFAKDINHCSFSLNARTLPSPIENNSRCNIFLSG